MPELPLIKFSRVEHEAPRRRRPGFAPTTPRRPSEHGVGLRTQIDQVLGQFQRNRPPRGVDPALVLVADLSNAVLKDEWVRAGLTILADKGARTLVLFSSDEHLTAFRDRLSEYQRGPRRGNRHAPHAALFSNIEGIRPLQPADRIGRILQNKGLTAPGAFEPVADFVLDVELWHTGDRLDCVGRVRAIKAFVEGAGGTVPDSFVGESIVVLRVKAKGSVIQTLLSMDAVAVIDAPPHASGRRATMVERGIDGLRLGPRPGTGAPGLCVVDSGISSGHPLLGPWVGEATAVPAELGDTSDQDGHGTLVAGIALYGDVELCLDAGEFSSPIQIFSARILNADGEFASDHLILSQMTGAITYFRDTYKCRVFNLSIGDDRLLFLGGRVSGWTAVIDDLARRLDVVIVISAGNYFPPFFAGQRDGDRASDYPRYLLGPAARIIEPATASIAVTVGSLARSQDVPQGSFGPLSFRPIALAGEPSPFTRTGSGIMDAVKPDLCAYGGNSAVDQHGMAVSNPEGEVVSLNADYVAKPFSSAVGTSLAAPVVANIASRVIQRLPSASANLVRALMASSARVPDAALRRVDGLDADGVLKFCGYGVPDLVRATTSSPNRVVLYAMDNIPIDSFHVFELPIPPEFQGVSGVRTIGTTLAFDPPVRHTRLDYLGHEMGFRLIRGKTLSEVVRAYRAARPGEARAERISTPYNCTLDPGPRRREGGTLQKGVFSIRRSPGQYGDTYYVVVTSHGKWLDEQSPPQPYAVVVTVEHQAQVDIYNRISERVRERIRVRR